VCYNTEFFICNLLRCLWFALHNVNRFLDSRMFATCSDDTTVCLWDLRNMSRNVCVLRGHTNWVKNIEYVSHSGLLVTSGFDGNINLWDINRCSA
jgi:WD repeat-containing protein 32